MGGSSSIAHILYFLVAVLAIPGFPLCHVLDQTDVVHNHGTIKCTKNIDKS